MPFRSCTAVPSGARRVAFRRIPSGLGVARRPLSCYAQACGCCMHHGSCRIRHARNGTMPGTLCSRCVLRARIVSRPAMLGHVVLRERRSIEEMRWLRMESSRLPKQPMSSARTRHRYGAGGGAHGRTSSGHGGRLPRHVQEQSIEGDFDTAPLHGAARAARGGCQLVGARAASEPRGGARPAGVCRGCSPPFRLRWRRAGAVRGCRGRHAALRRMPKRANLAPLGLRARTARRRATMTATTSTPATTSTSPPRAACRRRRPAPCRRSPVAVRDSVGVGLSLSLSLLRVRLDSSGLGGACAACGPFRMC